MQIFLTSQSLILISLHRHVYEHSLSALCTVPCVASVCHCTHYCSKQLLLLGRKLQHTYREAGGERGACMLLPLAAKTKKELVAYFLIYTFSTAQTAQSSRQQQRAAQQQREQLFHLPAAAREELLRISFILLSAVRVPGPGRNPERETLRYRIFLLVPKHSG